MELANEFARIEVTLDERGQGTRLKIHSVMLGRSIYFDPLELELLTWCDKEIMNRLISTPWGPEGDFIDAVE